MPRALAIQRFWLLTALLLGACASEPQTAGLDAAVDADSVGGTSLEVQDSTSDIADSSAMPPQLPAVDREALLLLLAWADLPSDHTAAVWPGLKVLQVPTALVVFDDAGVARRAWLLHWPAPPPGAQALQDPAFSQAIWRYDAAAADAYDETTALADWDIAGTSALLVPVSAAWLKGGPRPGGPWSQLVGAAAMSRWRQVEGQWPAVAPCGQPFYPRDELAIALLFLECAVLSEALDSAAPDQMAQRLAEWQAIRSLYTGASAALMARVRHYDAVFAPDWYAGRRLALMAGQRSPAQVEAEYRAALARPMQVAPGDFDAVVSSFGAPGAAALELARRLGWPAVDAYAKGGSVATELESWVGPPAPGLVDQAIARHPWRSMRARAQKIMAIPVGFLP
jgi:hypothetical protein